MRLNILCSIWGLVSFILLAYLYGKRLSKDLKETLTSFSDLQQSIQALDSDPSGILPREKKSRQNITVAFTGRLGNHIFMYASLVAIAKQNNLNVVLQENDKTDLYDIFDLQQRQKVTEEAVVRNYSVFRESWGVGEFDNRTQDLAYLHKNRTNVLLSGYFQSFK